MKARDDAMEYICGDGYDAKERLDEVERIFRTDERAKTIDCIASMFRKEFDKQNKSNSLYVPTVIVNENIFRSLEQLK